MHLSPMFPVTVSVEYTVTLSDLISGWGFMLYWWSHSCNIRCCAFHNFYVDYNLFRVLPNISTITNDGNYICFIGILYLYGCR